MTSTDTETPPEPDVEVTEHELTDSHDREDYVADNGRTVVSNFFFADGTGLKAWTSDGGRTYTTRNLDESGRAIFASTVEDMQTVEVNAQVAFNAHHAAQKADRT